MASPDWTARLSPELAGQLAPGETVIRVVPVGLTAGSDRSAPVPRPPQVDERGPGRRAAEGGGEFLAALATGTSPIDVPAPDVDRRLNGVGVSGSAESIARSTAGLLAGSTRHYLAVTDRRVVVVAAASALASGRGERHRVTGSIGRDRLTAAEHRPVLITRGRVELRFVDGSVLAVQTTPQFTSGAAKELVRALTP